MIVFLWSSRCLVMVLPGAGADRATYSAAAPTTITIRYQRPRLPPDDVSYSDGLSKWAAPTMKKSIGIDRNVFVRDDVAARRMIGGRPASASRPASTFSALAM